MGAATRTAWTVDRLLQVDPTETASAVGGLVTDALGVTAAPGSRLEAVAYPSGAPATAALFRLRGTDTDGAPWSLFCKVLQHVRHWPALALMPPGQAAHFAADFPWRCEVELWDPAVLATLPPGLRAPVLHRVVELPDDRLAVWQEDVAEQGRPWDLDTFARAARLLGRWNARSTTPEVLSGSAFPAGYALRMYAENAVPARGLAPLADDGLWSHPWLAAHGDLRTALRRLAPSIPAMLDRLDTFPQAMPHGDASPQNLLVPADAPESFVVIDISFRSPHALGFDLGQLPVGLVHAGRVPAAMLGPIAARILPAYVAGLEEEGLGGLGAVVGEAFATAIVLRSGFDALPWEWLDDPGREHDLGERVALSRFLVDQYAAAH